MGRPRGGGARSAWALLQVVGPSVAPWPATMPCLTALPPLPSPLPLPLISLVPPSHLPCPSLPSPRSMLELVFAPAEKWIGRSDEDIIEATMKVRGRGGQGLL